MRLPCLVVDYLLTLVGLHDAHAIPSREGILDAALPGKRRYKRKSKDSYSLYRENLLLISLSPRALG